VKKLFSLLLGFLVSVSAMAQTPSAASDCGRMVETSPGHWAPLNLCPDGTVPGKGCTCPGTMKWVEEVSTKTAASSRKAMRTNPVDTGFALPKEIDIVKYPILKYGELTPRRAAEMGLHSVVLEKPVTVYNLYRNIGSDGRFAYETLLQSTVVYANQNGELVYKANCSNRIAAIADCPKCTPIAPSALPGTAATNSTGKTAANGNSADISGSKAALASALTGGSFWKSLGAFAKGLGWVLLALLLLAIAIVLASWLFAWTREHLHQVEYWRRERHHFEETGIAPVAEPAATAEGSGAARIPIARAAAAEAPPAAPFVVPVSTAPRPQAAAGVGASAPVPSSHSAEPDGMSALAGTAGQGDGAPRSAPGTNPGTDAPSGADAARKFVAIYAGSASSPTKINFGGYKEVKISEEGGKTTLTVV
jgi:hypothetical protein